MGIFQRACLLFLLLWTTCSVSPSLRVIKLEGSPYQRGRVHGHLLKNEIHEILNNWQYSLASRHHDSFDSLKCRFLRHTDYDKAIETWTPELMDEIRGIADGAGIDYNTLFLFQIGEELDAYYKTIHPKCTAIGVHKTDHQPTLLAQNMDPPNVLHGFPTVLHIVDSNGLETFIYTAPGLIALNGMNNRGIGVTCNSLAPRSIKKTGLPVAFVVRGILKQTNTDSAVSFIHSIEHANGQNYIVGGPQRARSFECSTMEVNEFIPSETQALTYHTNHYLVDAPSQYCSRLLSLQEEIQKRDYDLAFDDIKRILSLNMWDKGRPICNPFTYGSTIMILSDKPELYIAPGMPDRTPYQRLVFE